MNVSVGPCCPGNSSTKRITVGGHQIGISFLDQIIEKAMARPDSSEDELKAILLREVKIYNYVPPSAEDEYAEAIWMEFVKERTRRSR